MKTREIMRKTRKMRKARTGTTKTTIRRVK